MNWLESLLYGLISGITEFLPISTLAHQQLLLKLLGKSTADPLQELFVHLALLAAVIIGCRNLIDQLRRGQHLQKNNRRGVRGNSDVLEMRFLKNAVLPMYIGYFILFSIAPAEGNLLWVALFSCINAFILFVPSRMMRGNKDERFVSLIDSVIIGISGALSVFSGISRMAAMLAATTIRGFDPHKAVNWALLLCIPALLLLSFMDVLNLFSVVGGTQISGNIIGYLLSAAGAYITGYIGVLLMRSMTANNDHSGFSYYALGVAFFALFLYLFVV